MPRPGTDPIGIRSTTKMSFSFGSRMTSVESEWLMPTYFSSSVVPPSVIVLPSLPTVSSTGTVCGSLMTSSRSLARLWAMTRAPASLNALPPAM